MIHWLLNRKVPWSVRLAVFRRCPPSPIRVVHKAWQLREYGGFIGMIPAMIVAELSVPEDWDSVCPRHRVGVSICGCDRSNA